MCELWYGSNNAKILGYCLFYFVPTTHLMYCYGSIFHSKHMQGMARASRGLPVGGSGYGPIKTSSSKEFAGLCEGTGCFEYLI